MLDSDQFDLRQVQAIFFDLGMVLYKVDWQLAIPRFTQLSGGERTRVLEFLAHSFHNEYELGRFTEQEFFERACQLMGFQGTYDEFAAIWSEIFTPIPGTIGLAERIAERYPLYAISNTNRLHAEYLEKHFDLLKRFQDRFYSFQAGARKPDARIYQYALEQAGVAPGQALLIDDREENIHGARAVGMQAVHVPTPPAAQERLAPLLFGTRAKRQP